MKTGARQPLAAFGSEEKTGARQRVAAFGSEEKVCGPACCNPTPVVAPNQVVVQPDKEMVLGGMW